MHYLQLIKTFLKKEFVVNLLHIGGAMIGLQRGRVALCEHQVKLHRLRLLINLFKGETYFER